MNNELDAFLTFLPKVSTLFGGEQARIPAYIKQIEWTIILIYLQYKVKYTSWNRKEIQQNWYFLVPKNF